jgi:hypothetical protein
MSRGVPCNACEIPMGWCNRADQDLNTRSPIPNLAVVTPQRDGIQEQSGGREGNTPVFIAVKRLNNKAQGRRVRGAPWGQPKS